MKTEIYNVEGIEIEVERTSKDDTEAERRKMAYTFKMIREQSGMACCGDHRSGRCCMFYIAVYNWLDRGRA